MTSQTTYTAHRQRAKAHRKTLRQRILDHLIKAGSLGLTSQELRKLTNSNSVAQRVRELRAKHLIDSTRETPAGSPESIVRYTYRRDLTTEEVDAARLIGGVTIRRFGDRIEFDPFANVEDDSFATRIEMALISTVRAMFDSPSPSPSQEEEDEDIDVWTQIREMERLRKEQEGR